MRNLSRQLGTACVLAAALHSHAAPAVVYDQGDFGIGTGPIASRLLPINDFVLAGPTLVTGFRVWMRDAPPWDFLGGDGLADGVFRSFSGTLSWYFFADAAGAPGGLLASGNAAPSIVDTGVNTLTILGDLSEDIFELTVMLPAGLNLGPGRGWLGIREGAIGSAYDGTEIVWMGSIATQGAGRYAFFDGAGLTDLQGPFELDAAFQILAGTVPEPTSAALLAAALAGALGVRVRPRAARARPARAASHPAPPAPA